MTDKASPITFERDAAVARITIDNPPLNLLDVDLMGALSTTLDELHDDHEIDVVIVQSADPEFFVAHGDMRLVTEPGAFEAFADVSAALNPMQVLHERIRTLPQVTIGKLAGFARGGGFELAMALDLRYGIRGRTGLAQPEATMGIIPGGGGSQYLPRLLGSPHALELILSGDLVDADDGVRLGLLNRAFDSEAEMDTHVDALATHVGSMLDGVARAAKAAVVAAAELPMEDGLARENALIGDLFANPAARELTLAALEAGAQTREGERRLEELARGLARPGV